MMVILLAEPGFVCQQGINSFQTMNDVAIGDIRNKIRDLLGAFMFGGESSTKKVCNSL